jgi:hypothetical protein
MGSGMESHALPCLLGSRSPSSQNRNDYIFYVFSTYLKRIFLVTVRNRVYNTSEQALLYAGEIENEISCGKKGMQIKNTFNMQRGGWMGNG